MKADDLRRRLIDYARDPQSRKRATEQAQSQAQSDFEKRVVERLVAKGYRVRSQVAVGYYRIDIVVYGSAGRVAIECDGDRYHPIEKIPDDMARQATLERLGWRFIRIRGSRFYRDPEGTVGAVMEQLHERGFTPLGMEDSSDRDHRESDVGIELKERVIRRAHERIREWSSS